MIDLRQQLTLTAAAAGTFSGPASQENHIRAFGGQILAQALVAAGNTVESDRRCHSLHGYFLRPGQTDEPTTYIVDEVRDGRSFSMRRVDARQSDRTIFQLMASFHRDEDGEGHQDVMPAAPPPSTLPPFVERFADRPELARWFERTVSLDLRFVGASPFDAKPAPKSEPSQLWIRSTLPLGDDHRMHHAVFAYASDLTILDPILIAHGRVRTGGRPVDASLDHAIWFHEQVDVTDWLLFDQQSSIARGGRGLVRVHVWNQAGRLVATIAQEALLRPPQRQ